MSRVVAQTALREWKADPCRMVWDLFEVTPDRWQAEALRWFPIWDKDNPRTQRLSMQACAGPGKSAVLAWMGWNFLLCYGDGTRFPNGACVSKTAENLKNGLWKELAQWRERNPRNLLMPPLVKMFEMTAESIRERAHPLTWFLNARAFSKTADPEAQGRTLSGLHAPWLLYLLDESGDMPTQIGRSAEQGMSGNPEWVKIVMAGNATSHEGLLYQGSGPQRHLWTVIAITGDPDDDNRSPRVSLEWAREQIALYGRDNPWVMAYILGKFPPASINALLGPDEVNAALGRHLSIDKYAFAQKRLGIDVARFGDDATVIFPRQGLAAFNFVKMRNARTDEIAARVVAAKSRWDSEMEFIDSTGGWGGGVEDAARLGGIHLIPVNASGKADDPRFFNKRSETAFRAAEWVKKGGALPNAPELTRQATAVTYTFKDGKFWVLEKAQMKAQLNGQSPDEWDAFCLTFALADMPAAQSQLATVAPQNIAPDFDPFR